MSHTVKAKIEFKNTAALERAVANLKGTILGQGKHNLFSSSETGFGFTLPNWRFPLIAKSDGTLAYDDYNGRWGNTRDLQALKDEYALETAAEAAQTQGWYYERKASKLIIYHPDGGTLTVSPDGTVDAEGFEGCGCSEASEMISGAIGTKVDEVLKPEYFVQKATVYTEE